MMKQSLFSSLGFGALLLGIVQSPAMSVTIDLFKDVSSDPGNNSGSQEIDLKWPTNSGNSSIDNLTDVQWGKRSLSLNISSTNSTRSIALNHGSILQVVTDVSSFGIADLSSQSTIIASATFDWDGWQTGDSYIDLEENNDDSLVIDVIALDQGVNLTFTVTDFADNEATLTRNITQSVNEEPLYFRYDTSPEYINGTVDFNQVKRVQLDVENTTTPALDFTFDLIETQREVPFEFSPGLGIILSGGIFGLHWLRKKSVKQSS